jgi:protein TonB
VDRARSDYRSRGIAAAAAIALQFAFLLLLALPLHRVQLVASPVLEPMQATLIDRPHARYLQSEQPAIAPRLSKPTVHLADTPPHVDIVIPIEIPPAPQPSSLLVGLPPGTHDVPGKGSSAGDATGAGDGSGPSIVHTVPPLYSADSAAAHEHGTVAVRVLVDAQGLPSQIRVARSSGFARLDAAATEAVRRYRFRPAIRKAQPQQSWTTVAVDFSLLMAMPVPTSFVWFNPGVAEQVTAARHSGAGADSDIRQTNEGIRQLAERLFETLGRNGGDAQAQPARGFPTPLMGLMTQGKLKYIRFVGLARRGFDCGNPDLAFDGKPNSCEVFEAQLDSGWSYWLVLIDDSRLQLKNVLITAQCKAPCQ